MIWYKIVERRADGLYTLFHGNNGSRKISLGQWLTADVKKVSDGTNGTRYTSGWHVLGTAPEARRYLQKFTADRKLVVVSCRARSTTPKHHSRYDVHLARYLFIHEEAFK